MERKSQYKRNKVIKTTGNSTIGGSFNFSKNFEYTLTDFRLLGI